jgi:hypothetical protein
MNKWIKIAQHEDLDNKHREYLKALESENSNSYNMRLELAEESFKRANSVLSGTKNINGMKVSFVDLPVQHNTRKPITYSKLLNNYGRVTILADINGVRVPFYISTGQGGKENVAIGKWYTFFGEHEKGWMNKGKQDQINSSYGSKKLAAIEDWLDTNLNFLKTSHPGGEFNPILPARIETKLSKIHIPLINRDMKPASTVKHDYDYAGPEKATELRNMTPKQQNELYQKYNRDLNENVSQLIEKLDRSTDPNNISSPADVLKNYIISQCKGDAYDLFLWENGKSVLNNPPREIINIIRGMNPKVTGSNYLFDNSDAVNYFKSWVPMKTLGDEAFEYILDNNEEYLNLYKNFGRPTQKQNVQIIKKLETEGYASDNFEALDQAEKDLGILKSSKAINKIRF